MFSISFGVVLACREKWIGFGLVFGGLLFCGFFSFPYTFFSSLFFCWH